MGSYKRLLILSNEINNAFVKYRTNYKLIEHEKPSLL
jgi:hypothetical protein